MAEPKQIDLYLAIEEMKRISAEGGHLLAAFPQVEPRHTPRGDMANIAHARIRPKAADERVANASYKLFFTDTDTGRALNCWQCLIMEFNGLRTVLN